MGTGVRGRRGLSDGAACKFLFLSASCLLVYGVSSCGRICLVWERQDHPPISASRLGGLGGLPEPRARPSELPAVSLRPLTPGLTLVGILGPRQTCSPVRATHVVASQTTRNVARGLPSRLRPFCHPLG